MMHLLTPSYAADYSHAVLLAATVGHGGNTGDAIGGDIGPGGSCFAIHHSSIGDECGGSTGSSEPRSGSGDHSMNGGRGGEATVHIGS